MDVASGRRLKMRTPEVPEIAGERSGRSISCFRPRGIVSTLAFAGVAFAVALTCVAQDGRPAVNPTKGSEVAQATTADPTGKQAQPLIAEGDRKRQISDESTQLLAMAVALKAEVDKTNKDVLSLNVIRKADQIERLAHNVKEKMKQRGPS
jgi:hypothetical protein